jgi:hypothetical protein
MSLSTKSGDLQRSTSIGITLLIDLRARRTKRFLVGRDVFTLYSLPYCAPYNGFERANRTLKELTGHVADRACRRGIWQSDDLLVARLTANRLTRPWGAKGPTPEESWEARDI